MSEKSHIRFYTGRAGKQYEGRTFAALSGYHRSARALLRDKGAKFMGGWLFPEGSQAETEALVAQVETAGISDHAQVMKDRIPVSAEVAVKLKIGDSIDFGGDVGKASIVGFGAVFTPEKNSDADPRLDTMTGLQTVYVYNANPPKSRPARSDAT